MFIRIHRIRGIRKAHKHIEDFNPDVMSLEKSYQDFSFKMQLFNAGSGYENFNDFIVSEASEYKNTGDGVTYVVWNMLYDKDNIEIDAESFYKANGFNPVEVNMQPLHCVDSEYTAMYLALKEVHMNYDE